MTSSLAARSVFSAATLAGAFAMGDPTFLWDVRAGRELRRKTIRRVRDWMQSQRIKT